MRKIDRVARPRYVGTNGFSISSLVSGGSDAGQHGQIATTKETAVVAAASF